MPFLIKSTGGQRTCQLITNKAHDVATRDDIIEALRGLTFKFEIKIKDILPAEAEESDQVDVEAQVETNGTNLATKIDHVVRSHIGKAIKEEVAQSAPRSCEVSKSSVAPAHKIVPKSIEKLVIPTESATIEREQPVQGHKFIPSAVEQHVLQTQAAIHSDQPAQGQRFAPSAVEQPVPQTQAALQREQPVQGHRFIPSAVEKHVLQTQAAIQRDIPVQVKVEEPKRFDEKIEAAPITREPITNTTSVAEKAALKPISQPNAQQTKPTLIRAELKVGSTIQTPCVCLEDDNPPALCFVSFDGATLSDLTNKIANIAGNIDVQPEVNSVEIGDIMFAKSREDDAWYRAVVESICGSEVGVYYFDWGMRESLDIKRIRRLTQHDLGLSKVPACAVKARISNNPGPLLEEFLKSDYEFIVNVDGYDDMESCYRCTLVSAVIESSAD